MSIGRIDMQRTSRYQCLGIKERLLSMIMRNKASLARGIQGTESLWLDSQLSVVVDPSLDGAMGVIGVSGKASLADRELYILRILYR